MAFPTIPTAAASRVLTSVGTTCASGQTFPSLSSLTKNSGDLLIAIVIIYDGNSTNAEFSSWGGGFTEFGDFATTTTVSIGCAYKWSTGSETGTFTVTSSDTSTNDYACILLSIPGAHGSTAPEAGGYATGADSAANPGSLNPSGWDVEDTLWIAVAGIGETSTAGAFTGVTAAPSGYSDFAASALSADAVGGAMAGVAFLQSAAASADPGTFTSDTSNSRWGAITIAVRPKPAYTLACDPGSFSVTGTAATLKKTSTIAATNGTVSVTGTAATLKRDLYLLGSNGSFSVSGTDATLKKNSYILGENGSVSVTGTDATLTKGGGLQHYTLTADSGTFTVTGTAATLKKGFYLSASAGSFSVSEAVAGDITVALIPGVGFVEATTTASALVPGGGFTEENYSGATPTVLKKNSYILGTNGSITLSGTDATLTKGGGTQHYSLAVDSGSFSVSGTAATLKVTRTLAANTGSFTVVGTAATLKRSGYISCGSASFSVIGTAATLKKTWYINATNGSVAVTGTAATLKTARYISSQSGAFDVVGTAATLTKVTPGIYSLAVDSGVFNVTGTNANLNYVSNSVGGLSLLLVSSLSSGDALGTANLDAVYVGKGTRG